MAFILNFHRVKFVSPSSLPFVKVGERILSDGLDEEVAVPAIMKSMQLK